MIELNLFRLKVFPSNQLDFWDHLKPPQILQRVVKSLPSAIFRKGNVWHIGNISEIDTKWTYFRLGKTSKTKAELYQNGNFIDVEFDSAPYTHVLIHYPLEIAAIAKKSRLHPEVSVIANRLCRLLTESNQAINLGAHFEILPIYDPQVFIEYLQKAYAITRFGFEFERKNIFDVNKDFIRPLQRATSAANGLKGKTELIGNALDPKTIEDIARSAAATGNEVKATIIPRKGSRKIRKKMKGNPVFVQAEDLSDEAKRKEATINIIEKYEQVRHSKSSNESSK